MLRRLAVLFALVFGVVCLVLPEHQGQLPDNGPKLQTAKEAGRAFANITDMVQTNLIPTLDLKGTPPPPPTTPADPNATTTEPPYRITRQEALDLIRRNLYGLVRLFNREYRMALNDSRQTAATADEDLRNSLRPYFT